MKHPIVIASSLAVALCAVLAGAQIPAAKGLDIYAIDVEGGNATLFVTPARESVLIDSGWGGAQAGRDADRIMAAVRDAGLTRIDHLITTHWHADHFGGMAELASRIPIGNFIDHGPNTQPAAGPDEFLLNTYPALYAKGRHTVVGPGDTIAVSGLQWHVVSAGGSVIKTALPGAGRVNSSCAKLTAPPADGTENAQSVGSVLTFGKFKVVHLGDLTVDKEFELMCPSNRIGAVDLFVVSHHGSSTSNSAALVHAIEPRVAIMNNGPAKGGQPEALKNIHLAPGLEDLWQLHFSVLSGQEYTTPGMFIANTFDEDLVAMPVGAVSSPQPGQAAPRPPVHNGAAHWIRVSAQPDGSFTVMNSRNGLSKAYAARAAGAAR